MIIFSTHTPRPFRIPLIHSIFLLIGLVCFSAINAQNCFVNPRIKKITANISASIKSYMEFKPVGYDSTSPKKYPLLIYIGGTGEMFQQPGGTSQDLCPALQYSMPWRMNVGHFPDVVRDNSGQEYSFFVVMPFITSWGQQYNIDPGAVIDYVLQRYPNKIDANRIYLTAMSRGTDNIMGYVTSSTNSANRIAAMVPVANCFPANVGTSFYTQQVSNIANGNVRVWGISCSGDIPCTESYIQNWVNSLNAVKPGNGFFSYASWACDAEGPNASHHYAWNHAYDPSYRAAPGNKNVYEWMIQYSKGSTGPPPPPPVQPGCSTINITTTTNSIMIKGLVAPIITVQVFNGSWATVFNQFFNNSPDSINIPSLPTGTYHLKVNFYTPSWGLICDKVQDAVVGGSNPPPPPPPPPPTGTPDCNNIQVISGMGNLKLKGLVAPVVSVQIFNNSWATVFNQSYTNSPDSITISTLPTGTYKVKVNFRTAGWAAICEKIQDGAISQTTSSLQTDYSNASGLDRVYESTGRVITVAPNPFVNSVYITIGSDKNENGSITIMDIAGRVIARKSVTLQKGLSRFTFEGLSEYRQGSYVLRLTTADGVQNIRLIKQ